MASGRDNDDNLASALEDAFGSTGDDGGDDLASALLQALGGGSAPEPPEPSVRAEPEKGEPRALVDESEIKMGAPPSQDDADQVACSSCGEMGPESHRFCGVCGAAVSDVDRRQRRATPLARVERQEITIGVQLVAINEDGSDGMDIPLRYSETIIGRSGDTRFPTDSFLSPEHSRLVVEGTKLFIEDLYSLNGTYIRIHDEVRMQHGDCFLMGRQVLRFERFEQTITPKARSADGTRYMGSPPPGGTFKILQVGIGGIFQNVYCLPESGAVLGREKGDIVFPRDRFMSGRHAQIYPRDDGHYYLVDLNSSNGTWIKIWDRHQLEHGDLIFLGQQLFRVEAPDLAKG